LALASRRSERLAQTEVARGSKESALPELPSAVKAEANRHLLEVLEFLQNGRFEFAFRTGKKAVASLKVSREKPEKPNRPLRLMREVCESPPLGCFCHFGVEGDENQILQACGTMLHHKKVTCIGCAQSHSSIEGLQWFYPISFGFDPTHTRLNRSPKLPSRRRGLAANQCRFGFNF
jgi:hypothetical protein